MKGWCKMTNGYKLYNLTVRNGPTKKTIGKDTSSTIRRYKTVINETTITENSNKKANKQKDAKGDERKQNKMTTQNGGTEWRSIQNCDMGQNEWVQKSARKDSAKERYKRTYKWLTYTQTLTDRPTHKPWLIDLLTNTDWPTYTQTMTDWRTHKPWLTYTQTMTDLHTNHDWLTYTQTLTLHTNTDWLTYTQTMTAVKAHSQSQHDEEFASSVPGSFAYAGALSDAGKIFYMTMRKDMPMDDHHSAQPEYILLDKQNLKQK